jgi:hypothetical protein
MKADLDQLGTVLDMIHANRDAFELLAQRRGMNPEKSVVLVEILGTMLADFGRDMLEAIEAAEAGATEVEMVRLVPPDTTRH